MLFIDQNQNKRDYEIMNCKIVLYSKLNFAMFFVICAFVNLQTVARFH